MSSDSGGRRHEVIVLEVRRNKNAAKTELFKLSRYFNRHNENYSFVCSSYGSPKNAFLKTWETELAKGLIENPHLTIYEIHQIAKKQGKITTAQLVLLAGVSTFEEFGQWMLGKKEVKKLGKPTIAPSTENVQRTGHIAGQ